MADKSKNPQQSINWKQIVKITGILALWLLFLLVVRCLNLFDVSKADPTILLVIHAGVFLFALLTSPATFEINALGVRIAANKPGHIHFTVTRKDEDKESSKKTSKDIRDFQNEWTKEEIKEMFGNGVEMV